VNSTNLNLRSALVALLCSIALAGCGGGSGGTGNVASGGTGGTGISFGPVTGFGSIFVTGVEYQYAVGSVQLDDNPGDGNDEHGGLRPGMIVRVHGEIDDGGVSGNATDIEYEDTVTGPIASIVSAGGTFPYTLTVLGQTVIVGGDTCNPNTVPAIAPGHACIYVSNTVGNISSLAQNDVVEVSGFIDEQGGIQATYIEKKSNAWSSSMKLEVKGKVGTIDDPNNPSSFTINGLTVNIAGNTDMHELPGGSLSVGDYVEAKGTIATIGSTIMTAAEVEGESEGLDLSDSSKAEIEGYVTAIGTDGFSIGSQAVTVSATTQYSGTCTNLNEVGASTRPVEADGALVNGVLQTSKVECD
jgi:hypothetical protein